MCVKVKGKVTNRYGCLIQPVALSADLKRVGGSIDVKNKNPLPFYGVNTGFYPVVFCERWEEEQ